MSKMLIVIHLHDYEFRKGLSFKIMFLNKLQDTSSILYIFWVSDDFKTITRGNIVQEKYRYNANYSHMFKQYGV